MIDFSKHTRKGKIEIALQSTNVLTMPFSAGNSKSEKILHGIARELGLSSKTIARGNERYSVVLMEKSNQRNLL